MKRFFTNLKGIFRDSHNNTISSKRIVVFMCVIMMVAGFIANVWYGIEISEHIYTAIMYVVLVGVGLTGIEKFAHPSVRVDSTDESLECCRKVCCCCDANNQINPLASPGLTPTLSSISVDRGEQESTVPITLTGTNFTPEIAIYIDGWTDEGLATTLGLTVTNLVVVNSTTLTFDLVISPTAPSAKRNVVVSHTGGFSEFGAVQFQVGYPSASASSTVSASVSPSASVSMSYSPSASISPSASLSASPSS